MIRSAARGLERLRVPRPKRALTVFAVSVSLVLIPMRAGSTAPLKGAELARKVTRLAFDVRSLEEQGAYAKAADQLRALRRLAPVDADLELGLALDLGRAGARDSAVRMLYGPVLTAALADTADRRRFEIYGWKHEDTYFGGRFDGWYWYIARARLELEAARGRWTQALEASRICTRARPLVGVEWYLFALCAAHAGAMDEARPAAERALRLAPILPEAHYLAGVIAWRDGRRASAQQEFRAAVELDSSYREPAIAMVRARLPVPPDTLPGRLLNGLRGSALVTSPVQPKYDEFLQLDQPAVVTNRADVVIPDSLADRVKPIVVHVLTLFDAHGRAVFHEDPWAASTSAPDALVGLISSAVQKWAVSPGIRFGRPQAVWMELDVNVVSAAPKGG